MQAILEFCSHQHWEGPNCKDAMRNITAGVTFPWIQGLDAGSRPPLVPPCTLQMWFMSAGFGWIWIDFISTFYVGKCWASLCPIANTLLILALFLAGGHEDFSKMIDEAEPLGYPVVVKSTRGHRGQWHCWARWVVSACNCSSVAQGCSAYSVFWLVCQSPLSFCQTPSSPY